MRPLFHCSYPLSLPILIPHAVPYSCYLSPVRTISMLQRTVVKETFNFRVLHIKVTPEFLIQFPDEAVDSSQFLKRVS